MSKLDALRKILGEGAVKAKGLAGRAGSEIGAAGRGLGSIGKEFGRDAKFAAQDLYTGGKAGDVARGFGNSAAYSGRSLADLAKKHPGGLAAIGAGGAGVAGAGAYGINELLEELGILDDEEDDRPRRR